MKDILWVKNILSLRKSQRWVIKEESVTILTDSTVNKNNDRYHACMVDLTGEVICGKIWCYLIQNVLILFIDIKTTLELKFYYK